MKNKNCQFKNGSFEKWLCANKIWCKLCRKYAKRKGRKIIQLKRNKKMKYAIVNEQNREFYPDPIYTNQEKAEKKIAYLENYRREKNMEWVNYTLEILTPKREKQHNEEWRKFVQAID